MVNNSMDVDERFRSGYLDDDDSTPAQKIKWD